MVRPTIVRVLTMPNIILFPIIPDINSRFWCFYIFSLPPLHPLQNAYVFIQDETPESFRSVLDEGLNPTRDAPGFPKVCTGRLVQDHHEMVKDSLTGEREGRPMPFVVELQVSGGMSITKRVIRVYQDDHCISYFIGLLRYHDVNAPFT